MCGVLCQADHVGGIRGRGRGAGSPLSHPPPLAAAAGFCWRAANNKYFSTTTTTQKKRTHNNKKQVRNHVGNYAHMPTRDRPHLCDRSLCKHVLGLQPLQAPGRRRFGATRAAKPAPVSRQPDHSLAAPTQTTNGPNRAKYTHNATQRACLAARMWQRRRHRLRRTPPSR